MASKASPPTRLYLAIFLPLLSADRWLRERKPRPLRPGVRTIGPPPPPASTIYPSSEAQGAIPLVFTEKQKGALRIVAVNEIARDLGLAPGMALADARARVPDLEAVPHDPQADRALLEQLADWCDHYSPSVALDPPDGILLDLTGCIHLWGTEMDVLADLAPRLALQGFTARIALAETPDKARAMARHGQDRISINRRIDPGTLHEERAPYFAPPPQAAGSLPVMALDPQEAEATALRRAGLYTLSDLTERPRTLLAARFGAGITDRLARVLGEEDIRIVPRRTLPALFTLHRFAEPVARTDYVLETLAELARETGQELRERGEGARYFTVSLFRSDGDTRRLSIETGSATRDPALLIRLFRERIDTLADPLDPGFGYDAIRLDVARTEKLCASQGVLDGRETKGESVAALLDRLGVRLGQDRVRGFVPGNSHIPEMAGLTVAVLNTASLSLSKGSTYSGTLVVQDKTALRQAQGCGLDAAPTRPLHLFDPPQRVEVIAEVPDGPPRRFRWRRVTHHVVAQEGPERIAPEWWRKKRGHEAGQGGVTRDYYRVEDSEGRRFWLFRHGLYGQEKANPDWYLHGTFV